MNLVLANSAPSTAQLQNVLQSLLNPENRAERRLVCLERRPSAYGSSYALEELETVLADGTRLDLMFKDLSPARLSLAARRAKPSSLCNPVREIELYRTLLAEHELGTARFYGNWASEKSDQYWLFIEHVDGVELYQVGDFAVWKAVARWLAAFHVRFGQRSGDRLLAAAPLICYELPYYEHWFARARGFFGDSLLSELTPCYSQFAQELSLLPATLIHGEFYASNILIARGAAGVRVCPVDWEQAALGPPLVDLAALASGNWTERERSSLAEQYYLARRELTGNAQPWDGYCRELQLCRLHLAVQWLGWSKDWSPPAAHRQDWLAEATQMARVLTF